MSSDATTSAVKPGDILADKYRVESVLGAGGMGVVVQAEHIELAEKVAIKFLLDDVDKNSEFAERFLREARAAVQIKSEHVARVIDVGRLASGAPYMVMEYLSGADLSDYIKEKSLSVMDAVDYVIQACEAMSIAHRNGIVHRDLKPANLYRAKRPDGSVVIKVLDFGISKMSQADTEQVALTQTSAMMGSPLYMAPEQMRSTKNADGRSDIWSLGVILYEFLAESTPFRAESMGELFARVMMEPHTPLAQRRQDLPPGLSEVVDRCLQKDPRHRFQSVEQLAVSLGPFASARSAVLLARLRDTLTGVAGGPTNPPPAPALVKQDLVATDIETVNLLPGTPEAAMNAQTNTTWEGSGAVEPAKKKSRRALAIGAAAVLAAGALGLALWSTHMPGAPSAEPQVAANPILPRESGPTGAKPAKVGAEAGEQPTAEPTAAPVTAPDPDPAQSTESGPAAEPDLEAKAKPATKSPEAEPPPTRVSQRRVARPRPAKESKPKSKQTTPKNPLSIEFK